MTVDTPDTPNDADAGGTPTTDQWDVLALPPELKDPRTIILSDTTETQHVSDFNRLGCEGQFYKIDLPEDVDAKITMDPNSGPLLYPVWITGGHNVHVSGLELRTVVQPGCDVGEANNYPSPEDPSKGLVDGRDFANIHPRLPGGIAIRLQQSGASFVEGVDIDLNGQEADCFVVRNFLNAQDKANLSEDNRPSRETINKFLEQRHVSIVNTRCTGLEGLDNDFEDIGDGIHGDFLQNQGYDNMASLTVENITYLMSSNGITVHKWNGAFMKRFDARNYSHAWDSRFADDDDYDRQAGLAFVVPAEEISIENLWINDLKDLNYGIWTNLENEEQKGQRIGAKTSGNVIEFEGMHAGNPPTEFAPAERTGLEYQSPY